MTVLIVWALHLHRQPARSLMRPYEISARARVGALWLLAVATLLGGLIEWLPYAHRRYDSQFFHAAVGCMSGFFVAWCCVAFGMRIRARHARR
jgi:hypothetical protein